MKNKQRTRFLTAVLCLAMAGPARLCVAQDASPAQAPAETNTIMGLTLDDVIRRVLGNNPEIRSAFLEWRIARESVIGAYAPFEPALVERYTQGELQRQNDLGEQISRGSEFYRERNSTMSAGLEGELPGGAKYRFGASMEEKADNLSSTYAGLGRLVSSLDREGDLERPEHILKVRPIGSFITEYDSFIGVSLTQPVLKGAASGSSLSAIRAARADATASFHNYRKQLMSVLLKTEAAYWNLVYAQERYAMDGDSVNTATKLAEDAEQRVSAGKMSELDRVQAVAGLASRSSDRADSYQALLEAMTRVKLLMADGDMSRRQEIRAVDTLAAPEISTNTLRESMAQAFEWACNAQPDYLVRRSELARENVRAAFYSNQNLPQVDLTGSWGLTGWGLEMKDAWDNVKDEGNVDWSLGLEVRIPFGVGLKSLSEKRSAVFRRDQARQNLVGVENEIISSLANVENQITSFSRQVKDAELVVDFTRQVLDAELSRLDLGKSTMRLVYDAEEDLALARRKRLETLVRYREALLSLAFVSGSALKDRNLERIEDGRLLLTENLDPNRWSRSVPPMDRLERTRWEKRRAEGMRERGLRPAAAVEPAAGAVVAVPPAETAPAVVATNQPPAQPAGVPSEVPATEPPVSVPPEAPPSDPAVTEPAAEPVEAPSETPPVAPAPEPPADVPSVESQAEPVAVPEQEPVAVPPEPPVAEERPGTAPAPEPTVAPAETPTEAPAEVPAGEFPVVPVEEDQAVDPAALPDSSREEESVVDSLRSMIEKAMAPFLQENAKAETTNQPPEAPAEQK